MELLNIQNFLTIRNAELSVRPFTVLIGPQANGKSVVAKLLYFFRTFLSTQYVYSIRSESTKRQLEVESLTKFEQIFPRYAWADQQFKITYRIGDVEVRIIKQERNNKKSSLKLEYSQNLYDLSRKAKSLYKRKEEERRQLIETGNPVRPISAWAEVLNEYIYASGIGYAFQRSVFIPASRSFFANLQKNVFSFLANNIAIDPLIKEFGSIYESSKINYGRSSTRRATTTQSFYEDIKQEIEKVLTGQYLYEDEQDWIVSGKRRINVANASSGQQEVLPLIIVILTWVSFGALHAPRRPTFFIEEPEAHLFPLSQRRLIGIFSRLYKAFNFNFVLTTHSPYVLTALNNLIMASEIVEKKGMDVEERVDTIIGKDAMIKSEDVCAYTIQEGELRSIMDPESRIIGSSIIDSVSDEFDRVFDRLIEVELC